MDGQRLGNENSNRRLRSEERGWPMRLWIACPEWLFRALGVAFFVGLLAVSAEKYWNTPFWKLKPYCIFPGGRTVHMPWIPLLIDLTLLLVAAGFLLRLPPRNRLVDGWAISVSLLGGFWPWLPIWLEAGLGWLNSPWHQPYFDFLWRSPIAWQAVLAATVLMSVGNLLDVWGYAVLCRSISIVPEARRLKTNGPYRWVRHPVYLGQLLSQAGVWLIAAQTHVVWIGFYLVFAVLQLYRSKLEDRVLEEAFGEPYREWKQRTFWFF